MKKLFILIGVTVIFSIQLIAQDSLYIYKSGNIMSTLPLNQVDSISFVKATSLPSSTVTDVDGNVYHTVIIGSQTWMVENLRTSKFRDGSLIENVTSIFPWRNATSAWCSYQNTSSYDTKYGKLYNYGAVVDARQLAPQGWHVPTDSDWIKLSDYL